MKSYKNSGYEIMGVEEGGGIITNYYSVDRFFYRKKDPPPPPKHFKYVGRDRSSVSFFKIVPDKDDPPPPASLLRLSKMPANLGKADLVKFLERHRYIFPNDFYKQRSLPNQIRAWVELFADDNFAEHYTEIMLNTLTKSSYYKPTNQIEYYCWWKGLPIAKQKEKRLFLSEPNSFIVFEREMDVRFNSEIIGNAGESVREKLRQSEVASVFWIRELSRERKEMNKKINEIGVVWSEEAKDLFFSQLKESLVKKMLQVSD